MFGSELVKGRESQFSRPFIFPNGSEDPSSGPAPFLHIPGGVRLLGILDRGVREMDLKVAELHDLELFTSRFGKPFDSAGRIEGAGEDYLSIGVFDLQSIRAVLTGQREFPLFVVDFENPFGAEDTKRKPGIDGH